MEKCETRIYRMSCFGAINYTPENKMWCDVGGIMILLVLQHCSNTKEGHAIFMDSLLKPLLPKKYMCWGKGTETEIKSELINLRVWSLNRNFTTKPSSNPSYMYLYLKFHIILTCSKCDGVVKKWDWDQKWGFFLNGRPWVRINLLWARLSLVVPGPEPSTLKDLSISIDLGLIENYKKEFTEE